MFFYNIDYYDLVAGLFVSNTRGFVAGKTYEEAVHNLTEFYGDDISSINSLYQCDDVIPALEVNEYFD